jgi:hypothetical protein
MKKEKPIKQLINDKPRLITRLLISILILILVILALVVLAFVFHKPITGFIIINNGDYTGTGYAVPEGFTINPEYLTLSPSNQIFNISVNVNRAGGFVYKTGYFYNSKINDWVPFNFPQSTISGSNWISENASTTLTLNASDNLREGYNYIVVYSCKKSGADWICGCESSNAGAACNLWMLQIFNSSNVANTQNSTNCAWDYDCASGRICINKTCIIKSCLNDSECNTNQNCINNVCNAVDRIGDGSMSNPFKIYNCTGLKDINKNLKANYLLMNNIDCSDTRNWNNGAGFLPIGNLSNPFEGSLNGRGYTISGFYINGTGNYNGLFSFTQKASISDLTFVNSAVSGGNYSATLVSLANLTSFNNIRVSGTVSGTKVVGGIIGAMTNSNIALSSFSGSITALSNGGGLIGRVGNVFGIDPYPSPNAEHDWDTDSFDFIDRCWSAGSVSGTTQNLSNYFGGLIGYFNSGMWNDIVNQKVNIINSYSTSRVLGSAQVGGFIGKIQSANISNSYATGLVTATGVNFWQYGGFNAEQWWGGSTFCFWDINSTNAISRFRRSCCIGKTTLEMKQQSTYAGWDFTNVWAINPEINSGYPYLKNNPPV